MSDASLGKAVLYFLAAAICALAAWSADRLPEWLRLALALFAIVFGSGGLVELLAYVSAVWLARLEEYHHIQAIQPASEILKVMAQLSPVAQVELAERFPASFGGLARLGHMDGKPVLSYTVRLAGQDVPLAFIQEFLSKSTHRHLCPVRTYADGSISRRYAQIVTDALQGLGWTEPAAGNQPAAWKLHNNVSRYFTAAELFGGIEE